MVRFFEPRPFTPYYRDVDGGVIATADNRTVGQKYHIHAPCSLKGVEFYNAITGAPTIRAGVWFEGISLVYVDVPACPVGVIRAEFAAPYAVAWAELARQRSNTVFYYAATWETSGSYYNAPNGSSLYVHGYAAQNRGKLGRCLYSIGGGSTHATVGGWAYPTQGIAGQQAMDLLAVCDSDPAGYLEDPAAYFYGALHPSIELVAGQYTVGGQFYLKEIGTTIHGLRFYTHDTVASTFKGTLWGSSPTYAVLATGTVVTAGRGVYDCMFTVPYVSTREDLRDQWGGRRLAFGVYNQTSAFFTRALSSTIIVYEGNGGLENNAIMPGNNSGTGYAPTYYYAGDGRPATSSNRYGVSLLVTEAL